MKHICIIGANSAIATACAERLIETSDMTRFTLVGRNAQKLSNLSDNLIQKGSSNLTSYILDISKLDQHETVIEEIAKSEQKFDIIIIAHATTPDQNACAIDPDLALQEFFLNGTSVISLLTQVTSKNMINSGGSIVVISSVAGDRGRFSNYLYGSAKAAVTSFTSGLRARLFHEGINVITVKPGYVDTPLNDGIDLPQFMVVSPEYAGRKIVSAIDRRKSVVYVPFFWYFIMLVVRAIPELIFKRMKF